MFASADGRYIMFYNMASNRNLAYFFRHFRRKHRLSFRSEHNDTEVWYMHISPLNLLGGVVAFVLVLFIIIVTLAAYTPILDFVPGYRGNRQREQMIENIMRVDSIERMLNDIQVYSNDISIILDGKTPITRDVTQVGDTIKTEKPVAVAPSAEDSLLRSQLEGAGIYSLGSTVDPARGERSSMELVPPVKGVISVHFSPKDNVYGIGVATAVKQQVLAVADGTVTLSLWTPDEGHIIQIQHANNLISVYKRCADPQKSVGSRVKASEVIGSTGAGTSSEEGSGLFEFELWQNGSPVDPESYIVF